MHAMWAVPCTRPVLGDLPAPAWHSVSGAESRGSPPLGVVLRGGGQILPGFLPRRDVVAKPKSWGLGSWDGGTGGVWWGWGLAERSGIGVTVLFYVFRMKTSAGILGESRGGGEAGC